MLCPRDALQFSKILNFRLTHTVAHICNDYQALGGIKHIYHKALETLNFLRLWLPGLHEGSMGEVLITLRC